MCAQLLQRQAQVHQGIVRDGDEDDARLQAGEDEAASVGSNMGDLERILKKCRRTLDPSLAAAITNGIMSTMLTQTVSQVHITNSPNNIWQGMVIIG